MTADPRKRNWTFLVYEDSAPADWKNSLLEEGIPCIISPKHDRDIWDAADEAVNPAHVAGTRKKPHWHVMMMFKGKKTPEQAQEISNLCSGVKVKPVHDVRGMARYFCHMDTDEKAPYSPDEIISYGGLDYFELIETNNDVSEAMKEIMTFVRQEAIVSYAELCDYCAINNSYWFHVITSRRTIPILNYLKSVEWEIKQGLKPLYDLSGKEGDTGANDDDVEAPGASE